MEIRRGWFSTNMEIAITFAQVWTARRQRAREFSKSRANGRSSAKCATLAKNASEPEMVTIIASVQ